MVFNSKTTPKIIAGLLSNKVVIQATQLAQAQGNLLDVGRLILLTTVRHRRQIRGIGFDQNPIQGRFLGNLSQLRSVFKG